MLFWKSFDDVTGEYLRLNCAMYGNGPRVFPNHFKNVPIVMLLTYSGVSFISCVDFDYECISSQFLKITVVPEIIPLLLDTVGATLRASGL